VAGLLFELALAVAVRAQAPETPFAFDNPVSNAASCGGGFAGCAGFQSADGTQAVYAAFTVGGGAFTVRIWNPQNYPTYSPEIYLRGGTVVIQGGNLVLVPYALRMELQGLSTAPLADNNAQEESK
jgi:hypothetical protein